MTTVRIDVSNKFVGILTVRESTFGCIYNFFYYLSNRASSFVYLVARSKYYSLYILIAKENNLSVFGNFVDTINISELPTPELHIYIYIYTVEPLYSGHPL